MFSLSDINSQKFIICKESHTSYAVTLTLAFFTFIGTYIADFHFDFKNIWVGIYSILSIAIVGMALRRLGMNMLGSICEIYAFYISFGLLVPASCLILSTANLPMADHVLSSIDLHILGFDWLAWLQAIPQQNLTLQYLSTVYASLYWQPMLLIVLLCTVRHPRFGWKFINAWSLTLLASTALFAFFPAVGNYMHHGLSSTDFPGLQGATGSGWSAPQILLQVRSGMIREIAPHTLAGLIVFPSFHAAAAVILAWGYWHFRLLKYPFALLNAAMWVSALFVGSHYLVDLIGGSLIAAIAIWLAHRIDGQIHGAVATGPRAGWAPWQSAHLFTRRLRSQDQCG